MDPGKYIGHPAAGDVKVTAVIKPNTDPLDAAYGLSPEQASFFKKETGIKDDDKLRAHILKVQEEAYQIFPYPCIRLFMFLQPGIVAHPEYEKIIKLGQERPDGFFLDIGCCFGADARRVVADGFPLRNVITTDLMKEFHDMGHALFNTTAETYPITFVPGNALDSNMLQIVPPFDEPPVGERPDVSTLISLNPLAGRCAVIYASNLFHVFSEENQLHLAKALAGLLSPEPGSMICGEHAGDRKKGLFRQSVQTQEVELFHHNPESWSTLWDGEAFRKGSVAVDVKLDQIEVSTGSTPYGYSRLRWSVVRL